jgi:hypothetical protein
MLSSGMPLRPWRSSARAAADSSPSDDRTPTAFPVHDGRDISPDDIGGSRRARVVLPGRDIRFRRYAVNR